MHPLAGPRLRLSRSKDHLERLDREINKFLGGKPEPYKLVSDLDPKTGKGAYRVSVIKEPDARWGVVIGEIAHNLRAALDGLTWQLAMLNPGEPHARTGFPIYALGRTKRKHRGGGLLPHFWGKRDGVLRLRGVPKPLRARIEAVQPYKRGNGGRLNPLFLLHEMNNADKHRLLLVTGSGVVDAKVNITAMSGGSGVHITAINSGVELVDGAEVITFQLIPGSQPGTVKMNPQIVTQIQFGRSCDAITGLPVIPTLITIHNHVSELVQSFGDVFE